MGGFGNFIKEFKEFRRFSKLPKEKRELVIYSEDASYHTFLAGIVDELLAQGIEFCYVTSQVDDPILSQDNPKLHAFYIKHLIGFFTTSFNGKVIVMTMPDLDQFHIKKSAHNVNHVYLFHNMGSYFHVIRHKGLFAYNTFFCAGPHHEKELKREEELYTLPKRELVQYGYNRLDMIMKQYEEWKKKNPDYTSEFKAKILFAPGWGPWDERTSALDLIGKKLITNLVEAGYEVVLRPHPMTRNKYPEVLDGIYEEFKDKKNFSPEENISTLDSFFSADLMIGDWSGVVYEYAYGTERPVLFIDSPMKVNNPHYKDFGFEPIDKDIRSELGVVISMEDADRIVSITEDTIKKNKDFKESITKVRSKYMYNVGSSAKAGAKYLIDYLKNGTSK